MACFFEVMGEICGSPKKAYLTERNITKWNFSLQKCVYFFGRIFIIHVLNSNYNKIFNWYNKTILSVLSQPLYVYIRTMQLCPQFVFCQKYIPNRTCSNGLSLLGLIQFNFFINDLKGRESSLIKQQIPFSERDKKNVRGQGQNSRWS